jgi:hypothetical protein
MDIRLEEIIEKYRQVVYDLQHQLLCYKIVNEKLEKDNRHLLKELTDLTEDPSKVEYSDPE